ncbi:hypothetical protein C8R46DRAFT_887763 [Mycena filopes]|nr:hypothetical protein C8R46DRAFT_887763 [Mycena filopes]
MARLYTDHTFKASDGIEIFYTDSGAPSTVDYTTLVVLHGSAFNGDGLVGLHEHAHKNNLRVVLWNRRDYRGSTKYTDAELKDLHEGRKVFQDRLALQLAEFFQYFIKHENTPALTADRKAGGFILMGWSFGNATTLSLLSDSAVIPKGIYNMIEPYIMSLVMYDPPYTALGYILPDQEKYYDPWTDPDYPTPEQLYDNFQQWVSSYYTHKNIGSGNREEMSFEKRTEKRTVAGWTEEQKEKYFDKVAAVRTELPSYDCFIYLHI